MSDPLALQDPLAGLKDPLKFAKFLWPDVNFYDKQREVIYSVMDTPETFVPAGNQLGKDFLAGFLALYYFLVHREVRVVTTSVRDDHLRVLWGEIGHFIETSKYPLLYKDGGPLVVNHREIKKVVNKRIAKKPYLIGMVSEKGEGMAGHHAEFTFGVIDEGSGVDNQVYTQMCTWAKRILVIGNCNPYSAGADFFYHAVKKGDIVAP